MNMLERAILYAQKGQTVDEIAERIETECKVTGRMARKVANRAFEKHSKSQEATSSYKSNFFGGISLILIGLVLLFLPFFMDTEYSILSYGIFFSGVYFLFKAQRQKKFVLKPTKHSDDLLDTNDF
jgi:hypothetical protein